MEGDRKNVNNKHYRGRVTSGDAKSDRPKMSKLCPRCRTAFEPTAARQRFCRRKRCVSADLAAKRARMAKRQAAYWLANRDKIAKQRAVYYAANRETILKRNEAYRAANRKSILKQKVTYRIANRDRRNALTTRKGGRRRTLTKQKPSRKKKVFRPGFRATNRHSR